MSDLLDFVARVVPRIRNYPAWARILFAVSFCCVLASVFVYVLLSPSASRRRTDSKIALDVLPVNDRESLGVPAGQPPDPGPLGDPLRYTATAQPGLLRIDPSSAYLRLYRRGGPLPALSDYAGWTSAHHYPVLDVKVTNNTQDTVYFTRAEIDVARAVPDTEPIVIIDAPIDPPRRLTVINDGWGAARDVTLSFNVGYRSSYGPYRHVLRLDDVSKSRTVDLTSSLRSGVDFKKLTRAWGNLLRASGYDERQCDPRSRVAIQMLMLAQPLHARPCKDTTHLRGEVAFWWRRGRVDRIKRHVRFQADVTLTQQSGLGDYAPFSSFVYSALLPIEATDYREELSLSQRVRAGDTDRFRIAIGTRRSAFERLKIKLYYNGGDREVGPVLLHTLVPRVRIAQNTSVRRVAVKRE